MKDAKIEIPESIINFVWSILSEICHITADELTNCKPNKLQLIKALREIDSLAIDAIEQIATFHNKMIKKVD
jgi:hypothetical protein